MLNKKLLLGSLAGATLMVGALVMLPSIAEAGLVTGSCVNCHTMHNSDDGATMSGGTAAGAPAAKRLLRRDCVGCHTGRENDSTTGRATADPKAPQVTSTAGANAAGYFNKNSANSHNEANLTTATWFTGTALTQGPGGVVPVADLSCENCHAGAAGAHHKSTGAGTVKSGATAEESYRMLGISAADVTGEVAAGGTGFIATNGKTAPSHNYNVVNSYLASTDKGMNLFCASCHDDFHGRTASTNTQLATGEWVRHPTDIAISTYGASYKDTTDTNVPVGSATIGAAVVTDVVMCLSCHKAHGSDQQDMLRFSYNLNKAGDATAATGCETCHGSK